MYTLLLICAMAIGQDEKKEAVAPRDQAPSSFQLAQEHVKALEPIMRELDSRGLKMDKDKDGKTVTISGAQDQIIRLRNALETRGMWQSAKEPNQKPQTIEKEFEIVKERIKEIGGVMSRIHDQKIVYNLDAEEHIVKIKGAPEEVERVRAALDDRRLLRASIILSLIHI